MFFTEVIIMKGLIFVFWLMDIINLPFMEIFDTTVPLNGLFWIITFIAIKLFDN